MFNRRSRLGRTPSDRAQRAFSVGRRGLDVLEERCLLASYTVINTNDSGPGSLRDGINTINLDLSGPNSISFAISGQPGTVQTIAPLSALPIVTQPVVIDGYIQPGASPNTLAVGSDAKLLIQISGQNLSFGNILEVNGGNSTVRGLVLNNLSNLGTALRVAGGGGNQIEGNFIGTNPAGTAAVGVGTGIIIFGSPNNTVGGTAPASRNLISGATANNGGVFILSPNATGNVVQGNYIGTDAAGTASLGNRPDGIIISNAANTTIGGAAAGAGNVIAGSTRAGIELFTDGTVIQGNRIGTNATGTAALGNAVAGILVDTAVDVTIGGIAAGAGNLISGNDQYGILFMASVTRGVVQGNRIGTDVTGLAPLANATAGISVDGSNVTIGGTAASAGNIIAFNGGPGVMIPAVTPDPGRNAILSNAIFSNAGLGIDLDPASPNANDPGDADTGPNGLQNYPVLVSTFVTGNAIAVSGTLNSTPNLVYTLELFDNTASDPSGFGEGQKFLGRTTVTTDGAGNTNFAFSVPISAILGGRFSATATDPVGNTSEFSRAFLPTGFVVTNTNDTGSGSLRQVITDANAAPGLQTITFNIPGPGVRTIAPQSALPTITDPVVLDGYSQPGASPNTLAVGNDAVLLVELDGGNKILQGLIVTAGGSTVRGLVINRFTSNGIELRNLGSNLVAGNFIGTDPTGAVDRNNGGAGLFLQNSPSNTIGGTAPADRNVILGNSNPALFTSFNAGDTSVGNTIQGNYIGSNAQGTAVLGTTGILLTTANNLVGGTAPGAGNVISTQGRSAIDLREVAAGDNTIQGNFIGVTADGNAALGNRAGGIQLLRTEGNLIGGTAPGARNVIVGSGVGIIGASGLTRGNTVQGNFIGTNAAGTAIPIPGAGSGVSIQSATGNTVGGTAAGAGNVIAGFDIGVQVFTGFPTSAGNVVQGNFVGTNAAGAAGLGNGRGIVVFGGGGGLPSRDNTIGGTAAGARNVISGNAGEGIAVTGSDTTTIQGNLVGVAPDGTTALGNAGAGIQINSGASNTIGGTAAGAGNVIAFNGGNFARPGIQVNGGSSAILGNVIFANAGLGIDLGGDGVTANDPGDPDAGANTLQNYPVITSVGPSVTTTPISATFNSTPNSTFTVEFFASDAADPSGFGEGRTSLGQTTVTTDVNGDVTFGFAAARTPPGQGSYSATATDAKGNTSEFSRAFPPPSGFVVTNTNDTGSGSLRQVITDANATAGVQTITFNIPAPGVQTIAPLSPLPAITDPVVIDAYTQPGASPNTNGPGLGDNAVILVELSGVNTVSGQSGLFLSAGGTTVRGLAINRFGGAGILIDTGGGNVISGNYLGTDAAGSTDLGNAREGVLIFQSSGNTIGGTAPAARNLLSGNDFAGVQVLGSGASNNVVLGNFVGIDAAGTAAIPNVTLGSFGFGIIVSDAPGNTIGGTDPGSRNVVSGNNDDGIGIVNPGAFGNVVLGNFVGTDVTGTVDLGNAKQGVLVTQDAHGNTIGGTTPGERNVISGNNDSGVAIIGKVTSGNVLQGNFIGTTADGLSALGNGDAVGQSGAGVRIVGAPSNVIGGTAPGAGNVISGNVIQGIDIRGSGAQFNVVQGNTIGPDVTGRVSLSASGGSGVVLGEQDGGSTGASDNTIGGTAPGSGNLISGNGNSDFGIAIGGASTTRNVVQGNRVGTNVDATAALGNGNGVGISGGSFDNTIGGSTAGAGNLISGNINSGVLFQGSGPNSVLGNRIGTTADGSKALDPAATTTAGISLDAGSTGVTIGGIAAGQGNLISGNAGHGILIQGRSFGQGPLTGGIVVAGNRIGTDAAATVAVPNAGVGVEISGGASDITIGGTSAAARNVISGNAIHGVNIRDGATTRIFVAANLIGTAADGLAALPNGDVAGRIGAGVQVVDSPGNTIGGTTPGAGNTIAFNAAAGVAIVGDASVGDAILSNSIYSNKIGIDLGGDGASRNTPYVVGSPRVGPNIFQNHPIVNAAASDGSTVTVSGTFNGAPGSAFTLQFFADSGDASGLAEGRVFIGQRTVTTDASGNTTFLAVLTFPGIAATAAISATATDPAGNTSEFSLDTVVRSVADSGFGSLRQAILNANLNGNNGGAATTIRFDIPSANGGPATIAPASQLPLIASKVLIDGYTQPGSSPNTQAAGDDAVIGVVLDGSGAGVGAAGLSLFLQAFGSTIRGLAIGGFDAAGIDVQATSGVVVAGNFVGVDASGSVARPNSVGLSFEGVDAPTIGGTATADRNLIAGNLGAGLRLRQGESQGKAVVVGNRVGVGRTDSPGLGNGGDGIVVSDPNATVGGTASGAGNVIAFNGGAGIRELFLPTSGVFRENRIFGNAKLGIDIGGDGVTPNQPPTTLTDPARSPNFPVISRAINNGQGTQVAGSFDGTQRAFTTLDFFSSPVADPSGFGQGQVYLGSISFTTDANGHADFTANLPPVVLDQVLTATATSFATSEFSRAVSVISTNAAPRLVFTLLDAPDPVAVADVLTYTLTVSNTGNAQADDVALRDSLPAGLIVTDESAADIRAQGGSVRPNLTAPGTRVDLPIGTLAAGATRTLLIAVTPATAGTFVNTATAQYRFTDFVPVFTESTSTRAIFTFTVLNNKDRGFGSLRQAILNADANPGVDTIDFKLPANQLTIKPTADLPFISDPTVIDGATQPGFAGVPIVVLDGSNVRIDPASSRVPGPAGGLVVNSGGTTIRSLVVAAFAEDGVILSGGSGSRIVGSDVRNNGDAGILIRGSSGNTIGGTSTADRVVASANGVVGIEISGGSARNLIQGSYIGLDATGRAFLGNGQDGVFIDDSPDNTVGGTAMGSRNVISANREVEVQIHGRAATRNVVLGNFLGIDLAGEADAFPPGTSTRGVNEVGVFINDAPGNTIGGSSPAARNVIGGQAAGVEILGAGAVNNVVAGNYIGTDATGTRPVANTIGVLIVGAAGNTIGGLTPNLGNVISANLQVGVRIDGFASANNRVVGNLIGLDVTGERPLGNVLNGIFLNNAPNNTIGGATPGEANVIANSGQVGINIFGASARGNLVIGNLVGLTRGGATQGNGQDGILMNDAPDTTIGGTAAGAGNIVAGATVVGIQIAGTSAVGEILLGNTVRGGAGTIGISAENGARNTVPSTGPGANDVTGGVVGVQFVPTAGTAVAGVSTVGTAATITAVTLTFRGPLNPSRAGNTQGYRIDVLNPIGRRIGGVAIASARYDGATNTVTLTLGGAISAARAYRVVAFGRGRHALTDPSGRKIDGRGTGGTGTNFTGKFGAMTVRTGAIAGRHVATFRRAVLRGR